MPKRKQGQSKGEADHEGRPPSLTLASFIQFPDLASTASSSVENEKKNQGKHAEEKKQDQTSESLSQRNISSSENSLPTSTELGFSTTENKVDPTYFIGKTKKGKLPLTCESRAKGKKVTVISNVTGNANALLSDLKRRAGCGGVVREGSVELQGDRIKFLTQFLTGHPCLKPYKT